MEPSRHVGGLKVCGRFLLRGHLGEGGGIVLVTAVEQGAVLLAVHSQPDQVALVREAQVGKRASLGALAGRLEAMSPLAVMARGYSATFRAADGTLVRRAQDVSPGERVVIRLGQAARSLDECQTIEAEVIRVEPSAPGQE